MCIGAVAVEAHQVYPVVLVFNRDEAFERPAEILHFWTPEGVEILAGRDTLGKGTWLGVSRDGKIAAILNYWESGEEKARQNQAATLEIGSNSAQGFLTRGDIPLKLLSSGQNLQPTIAEIWAHRHAYKSFNLLYGDLQTKEMWHCSHNYSQSWQGIMQLPRCFSVSNTVHTTEWEKTTKLQTALQDFLSTHTGVFEPQELLSILADCSYATPLPDIYPEENAIFVKTFTKELGGMLCNKGTVSSTVILRDVSGNVTVLERSFDPSQAQYSDTTLSFPLSPSL